MLYEYQCEKCERKFDVVKTVKDMEVNEFCPTCEGPGVRKFVPSRIYLPANRVEHAEYNPGLGQVVKNKKHREELAKAKGLIEVGNDFKSGGSMVDHFDAQRQEKLNKSYEDI